MKLHALDPLVILTLIAFASYRLARLITQDALTTELRSVVYSFAWKLDDENGEPTPRGPVRTYAYEFVTCPHCIGLWAALALTTLWALAPWCFWPVLFLAAAGAQSALSSLIHVTGD